MVKGTSEKTAIPRLVEICYGHGLRRVLISPGSRNAPLTLSFVAHGGFHVDLVPDERAAGFMALGMSQTDYLPTILLCTSGSAVLNYAPAVAEAFYQRVPLLIISADRPQEWVDQLEGQTMRQRGVLSNFLTKEINLPQEPKDEVSLRFHDRCVNEAINATHFPSLGPVHLNCHFREPLYGLKEATLPEVKIQNSLPIPPVLSEDQKKELRTELRTYSKVMIIVGMNFPNHCLEQALSKAITRGAVVLTESTSNLKCESVNSCIDRTLEGMTKGEDQDMSPDLIITLGGPLVSKKIKQKFRRKKPKAHWHIDPWKAHIDMFQSLTRALLSDPADLLSSIFSGAPVDNHVFQDGWKHLSDEVRTKHEAYIASSTWSDFKAYSKIIPAIASESKVQLANSAAVRYAQLFDRRTDLQYYGNRGVSGIDGCSSTAVGMARVSDELVVLLTGDMAFRYDVNAFWSKDIPAGLKCIVVNNNGGGIFRIIPGPTDTGHLDLFEAPLENSAEKVARLVGMDYIPAHDEDTLVNGLEKLFSDERSMVLEVFTPSSENAGVLLDYFKHLKG